MSAAPGGAGRHEEAPGRGAVRFTRDELHGSLADPVLGTIGFLNEVMARYPEAISFAPGAPHLTHLGDFDLARHVESYLAYAAERRGLSPDRARHLLYEYGPSRGLINDLVARALDLDQGLGISPDAVVVTVGAQEAMLLTLRALCRPGRDLVAVVQPCFVGITGAARLLDIDLVAVDETADGIDLDGLRTACRAARADGRRVRALYVAPDFANPSGTVLDLATRRRLLDFAAREDLLLLEDNAYGFTAAPGSGLPGLKALDEDARVVLLGTFAKVCLPGARVGFAVADQTVCTADGSRRLLADELAALKNMVTVNTSPISQAVIGGMLLENGGSLAALGRDRATLYQRNLGLLLAALDRHLPPGAGRPAGVSWNRPAGGFFVRMRLPIPADTALLDECASRYGVLWTPMDQFYLDGSGADELRLSCSYLDPEQIGEGVARLARFLREVCP
ncbi:PLP-dependent aminotransferase family protein [Streptomyces eurocidicus]|uniref:(S)-3,5-dihydroxyphenylglycine transaminase n=1 Tax=Streptomyces eurocidicus TaxID=66423 RepID=A0A7W8BHM9_STREU|nr:PLP-dependent aminotransferase family protein [Streptomyces eurocidicus]MBB5121694.1 (S)-3,5-dihydroxyphenylglycine transaminase [Streptomyces eurocidicus]MBF6052918.1 aminotransferase class I/II-fold pyridoxal phosphate-dependent enzyme [Streptomyces eurocidicus]